MPKQKSPQKTRDSILSISLKLFNRYGFEHVKMQDIIDKMASIGLSKGAIYHYFKSKDDILEALLLRYEEEICIPLQHYQHNGRDKLKLAILGHLQHIISTKTLLYRPKKPSYRAIGYRLAHQNICLALQSLIIEGNEDGSLNVAYPKAASEMLFWAVYVWLDSTFYPLSQNEYIHKLRHLRIMCEGVGLSIIDEEINAKAIAVWQTIMCDET